MRNGTRWEIVSHIRLPLNSVRVCGGWLFYNPSPATGDDGDWGEMRFLLESPLVLPLNPLGGREREEEKGEEGWEEDKEGGD